MSNELLQRLEEKVQDTVDVVELLRLENAELKADVNRLQGEKDSWEDKLTELISKFEMLESEEAEDDQVDETLESDADSGEYAEADSEDETESAYGPTEEEYAVETGDSISA